MPGSMVFGPFPERGLGSRATGALDSPGSLLPCFCSRSKVGCPRRDSVLVALFLGPFSRRGPLTEEPGVLKGLLKKD